MGLFAGSLLALATDGLLCFSTQGFQKTLLLPQAE